MKYRNVKTGFVIETGCVLRGEFWEAVTPPEKAAAEKPEEAKKSPPKKQPTRTAGKSKPKSKSKSKSTAKKPTTKKVEKNGDGVCDG